MFPAEVPSTKRLRLEEWRPSDLCFTSCGKRPHTNSSSSSFLVIPLAIVQVRQTNDDSKFLYPAEFSCETAAARDKQTIFSTCLELDTFLFLRPRTPRWIFVCASHCAETNSTREDRVVLRVPLFAIRKGTASACSAEFIAVLGLSYFASSMVSGHERGIPVSFPHFLHRKKKEKKNCSRETR